VGKRFGNALSRLMIAATLVEKLPASNYLRLDVDGTADRILAGASDTLRDSDLRSILVEFEAANTPRNVRLMKLLASAGLWLSVRGRQTQKDVISVIFTRAAGGAGVAARPLGGRPG
jgi:hypothetical protein